MKPVLQLLAASALSAGMVIGGVVLASSALSPEENPHRFTGLDIKDLWTTEPVRIDRNHQTLERLPPRYASHVVMSGGQQETTTSAELPTERTTASLSAEVASIVEAAGGSETDADMTTADVLPPEHFAWCSARYRSYDPMSNTYRSFSGDPRPCTSPFEAQTGMPTADTDAELVTVSGGEMPAETYALDEEHVMTCMERYRSYRPTDNTYQPYGGGPRRTCETLSF